MKTCDNCDNDIKRHIFCNKGCKTEYHNKRRDTNGINTPMVSRNDTKRITTMPLDKSYKADPIHDTPKKPLKGECEHRLKHCTLCHKGK